MQAILNQIRKELKTRANVKTKESEKTFFKEAVTLYGVKTAAVTQIGKKAFQALPDQSKAAVFGLCEGLWQSGYMEESFIACQWSYACKNAFEPDDFRIFEKWLATYVSNWASCDTFCNHTLGAFLEQFPERLEALKGWTTSPNRWLRRGAAVSLIIPAKQGKFLDDVFVIADRLLRDPDDLVQKGYGWMLKAASAQHAAAVLDYVIRHKAVMPRTALRYAIEKMTPQQKARAMAK